MKILILGNSNIVQKRIINALKSMQAVERIEIASLRGDQDYDDYVEALNSSNADLAYISLVNADHKVWAENALLAGKHVIVDKPAFLELSEANDLVELARSKNLGLSEALVYGDHTQVIKIKELFEQHQTHPTRIVVEFSFPPFGADDFRWSRSKGGGALYDLGPYAVSIGRIFFQGAPTEVLARPLTWGGPDQVESAFSVLMTWPNGRSVVGSFGFDTQYRNQLSIFGPGLAIELDRIFTTTPDMVPRLRVSAGGTSSEHQLGPDDSFRAYLESTIKKIKDNRNEELYRVLLEDARVLHTLIESCRSKK